MKQYFNKEVQIAIHLVLLAGVLIVGVIFVHMRERVVVEELRARIETEKKVLINLATITDRNAADDNLSKILKDCERRNEYDAALIQLATLEKKELITIQNFHESCGLFYAQQKALMVEKLRREIQEYHDLLSLYAFFEDAKSEFQEKKWDELLVLEEFRSTLLFDLSALQNEIISKLISGMKAQNSEIQDLISEAHQMNELLSVHDQRIDEIREDLIQ